MSKQQRYRRPLAATSLACLALVAMLGAWAAKSLPTRATQSTENINDLSVSIQEILRHSPEIAEIELLVAAPHPTQRIIHITDCHAIPRERFARIYGTSLPDRAIHDLHQALADQIELFQKSQKRLLRWLVDFHGMREVFHEGVSEEDLPEIRKRVKWFREIAPGRDRGRRKLTRVSAQLEEARADGRDSMELLLEQRKLEDIRDYELNFGAIGDLLVERPLVEVQAAEDATALAHFRSVKAGRRMKSPYRAAREAAIVRNLLSRGPCAVIVLGSAHDLSAEVRKQGRGQCEYIRVTTKDFPPPFEQTFMSYSKHFGAQY